MARIDDLRHMFNDGKPLRSPFIKKEPNKRLTTLKTLFSIGDREQRRRDELMDREEGIAERIEMGRRQVEIDALQEIRRQRDRERERERVRRQMYESGF